MATNTTLLQLIGAVYGCLLGAYIKSDKKSAAKRVILWIAGILIALLCVAVLVKAFND